MTTANIDAPPRATSSHSSPSLSTPPPTQSPPPPPPSPSLSKPNIAIIGATGNLARNLINTLLSPHPTLPTTLSASFNLLILFTRQSTPRTRRWAAHPRVRIVRWAECVRDGHGDEEHHRSAAEGGGEEGEGAGEEAGARLGCNCSGGEEAEVISPQCLARNLRKWEVGVVVNALSPIAGAVREVVVRGVVLASRGVGRGRGKGKGEGWGGVRLYFPPEFGLDDCVGGRVEAERVGRAGKVVQREEGQVLAVRGEDEERPYAAYFAVPEWTSKETHFSIASALLTPLGIQVVRLHVGLFLSAIGPWFGFHTARGMYSVAGDPNLKTAYTDLSDVARVILVLVQKAYAGEKVPGRLRVAGSVVSPEDVREAMVNAGAGEVSVRSGTERVVFRERVLARKFEDRSPIPFIRLVMAEGLGDYRDGEVGGWGSDNDYVNPGEGLWKWKGIQELAAETGGRPNAGA